MLTINQFYTILKGYYNSLYHKTKLYLCNNHNTFNWFSIPFCKHAVSHCSPGKPCCFVVFWACEQDKHQFLTSIYSLYFCENLSYMRGIKIQSYNEALNQDHQVMNHHRITIEGPFPEHSFIPLLTYEVHAIQQLYYLFRVYM